MAIRIIVDSSADMEEDYAAEHDITIIPMTIAMLTAQRPGNVAAMEWAEVDLDAAEWNISAGKMKTGHAHTVPLAAQAVSDPIAAAANPSATSHETIVPLTTMRWNTEMREHFAKYGLHD